MNKAVFLDRDGVINKLMYHDDKGIYSAKNLDEFIILQDVKEAIAEIKRVGFKIIVVSNQPGVAFGYIKKQDLEKIDEYMKSELGINFIYNCIHHPKYTGECECRKPKSGMLLRAAKEHNIDLKESYMIGDLLSDIEAGKVCKTTIMLSELKCALCKIMHEKKINPDYFAKNLKDAVTIIKKLEGKK
ncbi:HAD-IIIA family hydrolase [Candidatus Woesearchaeota archaeon]|nr:HAD-IIIA family hydrolase [Candidatus Woesearchaeota archaeon]